MVSRQQIIWVERVRSSAKTRGQSGESDAASRMRWKFLLSVVIEQQPEAGELFPAPYNLFPRNDLGRPALVQLLARDNVAARPRFRRCPSLSVHLFFSDIPTLQDRDHS